MNERKISVVITEYDSLDELNKDDASLIQLAKESATRAYSSYSGFSVGAALRLANGKLFSGNNQENAAYPSGLCAERIAIFAANSQYPDTAVLTIAVAAKSNGNFTNEPIPACGACLQVLLETEERFKTPIKIIIYGVKKILIVNGVKQLLPIHFSNKHLDG